MRIHCIGIGGIGLSALARYYRHRGDIVSGSDGQSSIVTDDLEKEGIKIYLGHHRENIDESIDMLAYSIAVDEENEELRHARSLSIPCKTYPEALGEITQEKTTIAVCGTHGKTTTTAMMYYAMRAAGINPTLIVGSLLKEGGSNFIHGDSEYLIVEACEYKRSFLNLAPAHIIITNIDADHLDYYKDIRDIREAFTSFVSKLPENGITVTHSDVDIYIPGRQVKETISRESITLSVPGKHNKENASLVLAMIEALGLDIDKARDGLRTFPGTWRRLEYKGETIRGVKVYDDYGHHPNEIKATLQALGEQYAKGEYTLTVFFQPHLHSRTEAFFDEFVNVLKAVDTLYILPIYKARKEKESSVSESALRDAINREGGNAKVLPELKEMRDVIEALQDTKTVVVNIGAGDAYKQLHFVSLL